MRTYRRPLVHPTLTTLALVLALAPVSWSCQDERPEPVIQTYESKPNTGPKRPIAKNIIVLISDGAGYESMEASSLYRYGYPNMELAQAFPLQLAVSTFSWNGLSRDPKGYDPQQAWGSFDYVRSGATDSAASATSMATGVKTRDAYIGLDAAGRPLKNVVERAEELGKSTGVVTTVPFSHATPAGFVAHNLTRADYAGIAKEMVDKSAVDVIMGTGNPRFDDNGSLLPAPRSFSYVGDQATWNALNAGSAGGDADGDGIPDPWTLIQDRAAFQSLAAGATPKRVIGVPKVYSTLQQARSGNRTAAPYVVPMNGEVPSLAEMTRAAINVLDDNPNGFFLMVEGGAIDWAAHANQPGRLIEEQVDFNDAIEAVVAWVNAKSNWGETLVVVTSDHETGYITGPGSGTTPEGPVWNPLVSYGAGQLPGFEFHSPVHTNRLIPLRAKGDAARLFHAFADQIDPVRGPYVDNTEIGKVLFEAME